MFSLFYSNIFTPAIMYNIAFPDGLDNTVAERTVPNTSHFPFVFFDAFDR